MDLIDSLDWGGTALRLVLVGHSRQSLKLAKVQKEENTWLNGSYADSEKTEDQCN
jgi:hypothetical protein